MCCDNPSEGVFGETFSWYDRENDSERGRGQEGEEQMTSLDHERVDRLVRSFLADSNCYSIDSRDASFVRIHPMINETPSALEREL
jgi:hypothetical protein